MFKFDKNLSFLKKNFLDAFHLLKTKDKENFLKNLKLNIYVTSSPKPGYLTMG
jgi:hypothetical protein